MHLACIKYSSLQHTGFIHTTLRSSKLTGIWQELGGAARLINSLTSVCWPVCLSPGLQESYFSYCHETCHYCHETWQMLTWFLFGLSFQETAGIMYQTFLKMLFLHALHISRVGVKQDLSSGGNTKQNFNWCRAGWYFKLIRLIRVSIFVVDY